jgi:hypothetical protein
LGIISRINPNRSAHVNPFWPFMLSLDRESERRVTGPVGVMDQYLSSRKHHRQKSAEREWPILPLVFATLPHWLTHLSLDA